MKLRFRRRKLGYTDGSQTFDLLAEGVIGGRRTTRYLASIRSYQTKADKRLAFWLRASNRIKSLRLQIDRESLSRAATIVPLPDTDSLSNLYEASV